MMKVIMVVGGAAILGGGVWLRNPYTPANVYHMQPDQVFERLISRETMDNGSPYEGEGRDVSGKRPVSITWADAGGPLCTVLIAPEGKDRTQLEVTCPVRGEAAAAGMMTTLRRQRTIEMIDASLRRREPNYERADRTAFGWPKDKVHHAGIGESVGQAMEMDAQMRRDMAEMEEDD